MRFLWYLAGGLLVDEAKDLSRLMLMLMLEPKSSCVLMVLEYLELLKERPLMLERSDLLDL